MSASYILGGCRTPIGRFLGGLAGLPAPRLGALAVAEALRRTGTTAERVDEVIMGQILTAGVGQAPARQAALGAGLPGSVAALTVNKMCGSGLKAVMLADQAIRCGDAHVIVAGGMECMSRAPHLLTGTREGWKFGPQTVLDSMLHDGLWCAFENMAMGAEADYIAASRGVGRADQDAYAVESHRRAAAAIVEGRFQAEVVPVVVPGHKGDTRIDRDEGPRSDTTIEKLAALTPAFDRTGTVTAGNASQLSDGAAAVVVVDEAKARESRTPLTARIVAAATSGVAPKEVFIAPVTAIQKVLAKARLTLADIDLVELNEAFAAQSLACLRPLELDPAKVNVNGGAIALGHPIGASGCRVLVTLLYALAARNLRRGLASLCLGGGNAVAMIVERVEK
ncbi:MAG TPA: acetyl-CoA C-acetyltransferase [Pirellulales bacterium]|jgi:acetyl-CoA C-acetyltransferase|nr:acetyl-CoA C-acetyltransferase [Pirellulales bacterium]